LNHNVLTHLDKIEKDIANDNEFGDIQNGKITETKVIQARLCTGKALKKMLNEYRSVDIFPDGEQVKMSNE